MNIIESFLNFFYPVQCDVCGRLLNAGEEILCSGCFLDLPRTNFHLDPANPVAALFWGRVYVTHAASYYFFNKGSPYQKLIHKLKYQGRSDIGITLGRWYAGELRDSAFSSVDLVIPVPLHPLKERQRGYNQSMMIARGIGDGLDRPLVVGNLVRPSFTETQTRKSRFERFLNMEGKFIVKDPGAIAGQHVLLVDDVVTTGSTLEACSQVLLSEGCREVSLATLAVA